MNAHLPNLSATYLCTLAVLSAAAGLSIDIVLPLYFDVQKSFGELSDGTLQLLVLSFVGGMFFGECVSGPLADRFGRITILRISIVVFLVGALISAFAGQFAWVVVGRIFQGFGAAGQKIAIRAMIRDQFDGAEMARVSSYILATFVVLPFLAPFLGQWISGQWGWRWVFVVLAFYAALNLVWTRVTLTETLSEERRKGARFRDLPRVLGQILRDTKTLGYILVGGLMFGMHLAFLSLMPFYLERFYGVGAHFPWIFGGMACVFGLALVVNGRWVGRVGVVRISQWAVWGLCALGVMAVTCGLSVRFDRLILFVAFCSVMMALIGILFGNLSTLVLENCKAVAGLAASVSAGLSSLIALGVSVAVERGLGTEPNGLFVGLLMCAGLSLVLMRLAERASRTPIHNE